MSPTLAPVEIPTRQINFTTDDGTAWRIDEYHHYSSLSKTGPDGSEEYFETVCFEHQDLAVASSLCWSELVYDGSSFEHRTAAITTISVSHPR